MTAAELIKAVKAGPVVIRHHIQGNLGKIVRAERCGLPGCVTVWVHNPHEWLCTINPTCWEFCEQKKGGTP